MKCPKCKINMKKGIALTQVLGYHISDFIGQDDLRGQTVYPVDGKIIDCMKCPKCGHSKVNKFKTFIRRLIKRNGKKTKKYKCKNGHAIGGDCFEYKCKNLKEIKK